MLDVTVVLKVVNDEIPNYAKFITKLLELNSEEDILRRKSACTWHEFYNRRQNRYTINCKLTLAEIRHLDEDTKLRKYIHLRGDSGFNCQRISER